MQKFPGRNPAPHLPPAASASHWVQALKRFSLPPPPCMSQHRCCDTKCCGKDSTPRSCPDPRSRPVRIPAAPDFSGFRCPALPRQSPAPALIVFFSDPTTESAGTGCTGPLVLPLRRCVRESAASRSARRDFWLQTQDVAILHSRLRQRLRILNLPSGILVMKLVAQRRAVRPIRRQPQFLNQYHDNLVARSVIRQFHRHSFILRRVVHRHIDRRHRLPVPVNYIASKILVGRSTAAPLLAHALNANHLSSPFLAPSTPSSTLANAPAHPSRIPSHFPSRMPAPSPQNSNSPRSADNSCPASSSLLPADFPAGHTPALRCFPGSPARKSAACYFPFAK